ncbi:MAG: DNA polymerase I, partial [Actinobacteria bacterium]
MLIIDGHSMAFRAFYALPAENFRTTTGQYTNAVYGFIAMLLRLLENERPTHIAVAFDVSRTSFRTEEYPEYKGNRDATPEEFIGQVELISQVLDAMGITSLRKDGYEADDILATLARSGAEEGWKVLVASGDRDTFQMVNDDVTVLYPGQGPGDLRLMTPQAIEEKYGVPPHRYPELAALVGETSDNLSGVPGVGPKTAAQWITQFDGLDNLLARADEIGGKRGDALRSHIDEVRRNRRLNHLLTDLDVGVSPKELQRRDTNREAIHELFDVLEFNQLRDRVFALPSAETRQDHTSLGSDNSGGAPSSPNGDVNYVVNPSAAEIETWSSGLSAPLAVLCEGDGRPAHGEIYRLAVFDGVSVLVLDIAAASPEALTVLDTLLSRRGIVTHDGKALWHAFWGSGITPPPIAFDIQLAAYLLHPERRGYDIVELSQTYLGWTLTPDEESDALFDEDMVSVDD